MLSWDVGKVPEDRRGALVGRGAPFEVTEELVLGVPTPVFARRAPNLRALLASAAESKGELPYLVFPERTLTFADVAAAAGRVAEVLATEHGVAKGDRVAFAGANIAPYAVAWWATVSLGAIVSSLNGWWTPAELRHGVDLTTPTVVFADERRLERLVAAELPSDVRLVPFAALEPFLDATGGTLPSVPIAEDDPLLVLFTSGTTGRPKAAVLSHRNMVHCAMSAALGGALTTPPVDGLPAQGAVIQTGPFFHVSGALPLASAPLHGTKMVFAPPGPWNETTHLELTERHRITSWSGVPTNYWRLLESPDFDHFDVSSVRTIGSGGAVFPPELIRLARSRIPGVRVTNGYGMSETVGSGTRLNGDLPERAPASVGAVEPTCFVETRDPEGKPLPDGEVGEICIRGACVFLGYWDNPDATAAALDDERWYRTGDYGRIEDGLLYLESRMRDLVIRGGENIYPIEIENRLIEHPDITDVCVVGVEHKVLGQEVVAVVVRRPGSPLDEAGVRAWAAEALAAFKVPAHVLFRTALPYTQTGKVLKHEVEADAASTLLTP